MSEVIEYQPWQGGTAHRLQHHVACKIQNGRQGAQKMDNGVSRGV